MNANIQIVNKTIKGTLNLSGSKSISNRLLILQALSKQSTKLKNLSDSDDTSALQKALSSSDTFIDSNIFDNNIKFDLEKGIFDFQIYHKFSSSTNKDKSLEFVFFSEEGKEIYRQPARVSKIEPKRGNIFGFGPP